VKFDLVPSELWLKNSNCLIPWICTCYSHSDSSFLFLQLNWQTWVNMFPEGVHESTFTMRAWLILALRCFEGTEKIEESAVPWKAMQFCYVNRIQLIENIQNVGCFLENRCLHLTSIGRNTNTWALLYTFEKINAWLKMKTNFQSK
jgi:hypothetical protein